MTYKYSVIIPVYNAETTLRRCVDSLLNQKYESAEIILINDGSKDQSGKICREYASKHDCIQYIVQANAGASAARNAGLAVAKGEYITFVDSDDFVLSDYFATLEMSDADFVIFEYSAIRNNGIHEMHLRNNLSMTENNVDIVYNVVADRLVAPWMKKFRRSIIEENGIRFKTDLVIGEDFIFGLEYMLCCESSQAVDRPIYCVDETGMDSITRSARYDLSQFIQMYRYAFPLVENCDWSLKEKEKMIQLLDYLYCRTAFARTGYCLQEKERPWRSVVSLILMFQKDYCRVVQPMNRRHKFMQWCVKHRAMPVFFAVVYGRILVQKIGKG